MNFHKVVALTVFVTGLLTAGLNIYKVFTVPMPVAAKIFTILISLAVLLVSLVAFMQFKKY